MVTALQSCLHLVGPNELLVISGRAHRRPDGSVAGYRVVRAGRFISWPLIETVKRMSLSNIPLSLEITEIPLAGGERVDVTCTASVKIDHEEPGLQNAVERFLDASTETVTIVAQESLEGLLRSVAKNLTVEEVQEEPDFLARELLR